jgi:hypothetical protein
MTDREIIRAEIERRMKCFKNERNTITKASDNNLSLGARIAMCEELLSFIDSLQEEPVSEDLEEAADCYKDMITPEEVDDSEHAYYYETYTEYQIADAFKAGAKWQKEQDQKTIELAEDHAMLAGMEKMKEQMMKNAVDSEAVLNYYGINDKKYYAIGNEEVDGEKYNLHDGDKVKLIIIKED